MAQPAAHSDQPATAPDTPAAAPATALQQYGDVKKRKLEPGEFQNCTYFKIRSVVRDLRPAFIEVLQAPDFQNCKAADEIRRQVKVLLGLSKLLSPEALPSVKKANEEQPVAEGVQKEEVEVHVKTEKQEGTDGTPTAADKVMLGAKNLEEQLQGHHGTYVVGGSPMGWNFLVYPGSGPEYYGVTKEAAMLRRSAS